MKMSIIRFTQFSVVALTDKEGDNLIEKWYKPYDKELTPIQRYIHLSLKEIKYIA